MTEDWYDRIEEPFRELVKLLRNNGFNTLSSCGHYPNPYIQIDWFDDIEITKLYNLLVENDYINFAINGHWSPETSKHLQIEFSPKSSLAKLSDFKKMKKRKIVFTKKFIKSLRKVGFADKDIDRMIFEYDAEVE